MMVKFIHSLLGILFFLIRPLANFIPINSNIWIFGSRDGKFYNDNSKYLFEYVSKQNDIRAIWLTKDNKIFEEIKKKNREVHHFYSLKGIYYGLISGVIIFSISWLDLPFFAFIARRKKIIQLWHGTPFRKVNFKSGNALTKTLREIFVTYLGREFDMVPITTPEVTKIHTLKSVSNINKKNIRVTGSPRLDILYQKKYQKDILKKKKQENVILYLPTWRNYEYDLFDKKYGFDFKEINNFLKKNKSYLVVKAHPSELKKYENYQFNTKNSRIVISSIEDIYPYLRSADIFLLDYSSIYFDVLLLDKPIIFLPFDFAEYKKDNGGFYYDYNKVTAGPKARNWNEVLKYISTNLDGKNTYKKRRQEINKIFNPHRDGNSSERVYSEVKKLINKK